MLSVWQPCDLALCWLIRRAAGSSITRRSSRHSAAGLSVVPASTSSKLNHPQRVPPRLVKCPTSSLRPIWRSTRSRRLSNSSARQRNRSARFWKAVHQIIRSTRSSPAAGQPTGPPALLARGELSGAHDFANHFLPIHLEVGGRCTDSDCRDNLGIVVMNWCGNAIELGDIFALTQRVSLLPHRFQFGDQIALVGNGSSGQLLEPAAIQNPPHLCLAR